MKPKAPKKDKKLPRAKEGKVKSSKIVTHGDLFLHSLREMILDCVIDFSDMEKTGEHNGLPVYTPKIKD